MSEYNARHVIEALRSGIPSRAVGEYFSEARPAMLKKVSDRMQTVKETGTSGGMIFTGRYGEGKTHLLNTIFNRAFAENMAVSMVSLGKETPIDKPWVLYQKLMANTWLPGASQPGFREKLEELSAGSSITGELLAYTAKELQTDKLYYLLKAFLGTQEEEERYAFVADLEGDFVTAPLIKRSFRRIYGTPAKFSQNFSKTRHIMDYYCFISHFLRAIGCSGWVILFDELELIGRFGKKTRLKSYLSMQDFLHPEGGLESTFSLFALSSSYAEDVIDRKHEFENVEAEYADEPVLLKKAKASLEAMISAPELAPLSKAEVSGVLLGIRDFHAKAYDWNPQVSEDALYRASESGGYLLRTRIRAAIELLDQLYQYGDAGTTVLRELQKESFEEEEDVPEL
ncbi:MAG: DUF2791 family P-loop domain-containing protein [Lachnospiraceae bacterium]|nr:DUF2791 family P-loop domain-containing protein [Lachnospiraceae bacterium]